MSPVEAKEPKFSDAIEVTDTPTKDPSANETITPGATCENILQTCRTLVRKSWEPSVFFPELEWQ